MRNSAMCVASFERVCGWMGRTLGLACRLDAVDVILLFLNRVPGWYIPTRIDRHHHHG